MGRNLSPGRDNARLFNVAINIHMQQTFDSDETLDSHEIGTP